MLHTKFWFWRRRFFKVFTTYGHGGHLGSCHQDCLNKLSFPHPMETPWTNFRSPIPWRLHMKFGFHRPSGFWGKDFKERRRYNRRTTEAYLSYKLTNEPSAQVSWQWSPGISGNCGLLSVFFCLNLVYIEYKWSFCENIRKLIEYCTLVSYKRRVHHKERSINDETGISIALLLYENIIKMHSWQYSWK